MIVLGREKYSSVQLMLKESGFSLFPLINAVVSSNQGGKIYCDSENNISIIFVLHHAGFSQCFFLNASTDKKNLFDFLSSSVDIPYYFHIYDFDMKDISEFESRGLAIRARERQQFIYTNKAIQEIFSLRNDYKIEDIHNMNIDKFSSFNLDLDRKFWISEKDFRKYAYGKCITDEKNNPVSICYSACVTDNISEIDVMTLDNYKGNGFGRIVTLAFINESIKRNIYPNWDCFTENTSSVKTALSAGFTLLKKYNFISVYNKIKHEKGRS